MAKFEASQKTLPATASKPPVAKGFDVSQLDVIANLDNSLQENQAEYQEVMATVENELSLIKAKAAVYRAERSMTIEGLFEEATEDDFADPAKAELLYKLGWDNGRGGSGFHELTRRVLKGSNLSMGGGWRRTGEDEQPIPQLTLHVEAEADSDEDRVKRTAELLDRIYPAQQQIAAGATVELLMSSGEDTYALTRKIGSRTWQLEDVNLRSVEKKSTSVEELLKHASTLVREADDDYFSL